MIIGFYNLKTLSTAQLKKFFKDAVMLSYDTHIERVKPKSLARERTDEITIQMMINLIDKSNHHYVCIDRSVQCKNENYGEIAMRFLGNTDYFLYIFTTLENLNELVNKYKLEP